MATNMKRIEKRLESHEDFVNGMIDLFNKTDLAPFKEWVAQADAKDIVDHLLGKFESLAYNYRTIEIAKARKEELAYWHRVLNHIPDTYYEVMINDGTCWDAIGHWCNGNWVTSKFDTKDEALDEMNEWLRINSLPASQAYVVEIHA